MSDYFDYSTGRLSDGVLARAPVVNVILDEISAGFAMLPSVNHTKLGQVQYGTDSGAANAYVVTLPYVPSAYSDGMVICFKAANSNSGASTINVNGLGVIDLTRQSGQALEAQDIVAGRFTVCRYNSTTGNAEITSMVSDIAIQGIIDSFGALTAASGVLVSDDDSTVGYLEGKLTFGGGFSVSTLNPAANEVRHVKYLMDRSDRTSNTMIAATDHAKLIDITANTFTQTLDAVATLGDGWYCYLRNSGSGDITIDPNAAETIDGLASFVMYPGECRIVQCTGTALYSFILTPFSKTFDATGTFTKPPGYSTFGGLIWSGGNSGQRTNNDTVLSVGGAGGGCFPFELPASLVGATETVTVGAGGLAVTGVADGNIGGASSFGSFFSVSNPAGFYYGGAFLGLEGNGLYVCQGFAFTFSTSYNVQHQIWAGGQTNSQASSASGSSTYGGGGGGGVDATGTVRAPGTSAIAGNGGAAAVSSNGTAGTAPAGGGGATQTGTASGAGADGRVIVWGLI